MKLCTCDYMRLYTRLDACLTALRNGMYPIPGVALMTNSLDVIHVTRSAVAANRTHQELKSSGFMSWKEMRRSSNWDGVRTSERWY